MGFDGKPAETKWEDAVSDINIAGTQLGKIEILFAKIEDEDIQEEIDKLEI